MKKITILTAFFVSFLSAAAQEKLPDFPNPETDIRETLETRPVRRMPKDQLGVVSVPDDFQGPQSSIAHAAPVVLAEGVRAAAPQAASEAGYLNPSGTFFLGMDEGGKGTWFQLGGVIGAWSDSIPCWVWPNTTTGEYTKIAYNTQLSTQFPSEVEDALYSVDKDGNFCDSIVANGGWDESLFMGANGDDGTYWQMAVPLQTVTRVDGSKQDFMLLNKSVKLTTSGCGYAVGGLPSGSSADGLWPMTNAININRMGISIDLIASEDPDGYVHYIFGSNSVNTDTITTPDTTIYERTAPVKLTTYYDKPQAPMYVKSISLALGSKNYNVFHKDELKVNQLTLKVLDDQDRVIATSTATSDNFSNMSYKAGQLLTFQFREESDYGELLHEGFTVSEAFRIEITGFSPEDEFGIYSAKCIVKGSQTEMLYEDGLTRGMEYEPYIMLNGIFNTLENYFDLKAYEELGYETGVHGDTIDINMVSVVSPYYKYIAHWNAEHLAGASYFAFYSTFTPYDSISRYWNMEIERPEYIRIGADYDYNVSGDDEEPVTLWDYLRIFEMFIYANDTPVLGDIIKVGKCGKYAYFRIKAIDGYTALPDIKLKSDQSGVQKLYKDGMVWILRDKQWYNLLGQKVK